MLSRPAEVNEITEPLPLDDLVKEQNEDEEVEYIKTNGYREHTIKSVRINNHNVLCSVFQGISRPIVPKKFRLRIFKQIHNLAHPGTKPTL